MSLTTDLLNKLLRPQKQEEVSDEDRISILEAKVKRLENEVNRLIYQLTNNEHESRYFQERRAK